MDALGSLMSANSQMSLVIILNYLGFRNGVNLGQLNLLRPSSAPRSTSVGQLQWLRELVAPWWLIPNA